MAPTKAQDTSHLDQFSAQELEDILVQLCDSEGVKVSPDDDKALKNVGKNALENIGLGGLGKKVFGGGSKKQEAPPASPDGAAPAAPSTPAPAPRPAADVIRELNVGDKQGLIGVLQSVIGKFSLEDVKTPEALFKFITSNPTVKTMLISGVQTFLAKAMQGQQAAKA